MCKRPERGEGKGAAEALLKNAHVVLSRAEMDGMELADFGLGDWRTEGAQIATFLSTERVGFKVICLLPDQTLPEHWHTAVGDDPGKEETFRVVHGTLRLYLPGADTICEGHIPAGKAPWYTCRNERILCAPQQITLEPGVKHWLQGGEEGCVVYSISSTARCALDPFTDPAVRRTPAAARDDAPRTR